MKIAGSKVTKSQLFARNSLVLSLAIGFSLKIDKKQLQRPSEIFPSFLGSHQEFVLDIMRRRRPFGFKGQLELSDDPVDLTPAAIAELSLCLWLLLKGAKMPEMKS